MGKMAAGLGGKDPGSFRTLSDRRRAWSARAISLGLSIIGFLTSGILLLLPEQQDARGIAVSVLVTAICNAGAYLLVRSGRTSLGAFLMIAVSMAQHVVNAAHPEGAKVTPFFASVFVMIAATCVTRKWLVPVYLLGAASIFGQFWLALSLGGNAHQLSGPYIAASVLLSVTAIVAWLHATSLERTVELGQKREDERELLSVELEKAARMEALGRLAGGIAHDFNNLLVVIQGSAELAKDELGERHPAFEELQQIQGAARRAADLTGQLLAFSRRQLVPTAPLEPAQAVRDLEPLVRRLLGSQVELSVQLGRDVAPILASLTQLEQVIFNLAANARDASEGPGKVTISVRNCEIKEGEANDLPAGAYVEISVVDSGKGISEEVKEHLFEPFFTTKGPGKGTGLGLATSFGIIHQMGGTITVESELGRGATFRILIPPMAEPSLQSVPRLLVTGASQRALVIDDDNRVRQLVKRILLAEGTSVVEASDARSTLEAARSTPDLDLIVTDIVLSAENGMDLLDDLRELHPAARLVVMSSFSPEKHIAAQLLELGAVYLAKPFSPADLIAIARGGTPESRPVSTYLKRQAGFDSSDGFPSESNSVPDTSRSRG